MSQAVINHTPVAGNRFKQVLGKSFFVVTLIALFSPIKNSWATKVNINALGEYNFTFEKVTEVAQVNGSNLLAKVSEQTGESYSVSLPFSAQQVRYIVANGEHVENHQPIAILTGYDVHHFLDEFAAAKQLFTLAQKQYKASLPLFNSKALKQSKWIEISQNFYQSQLRFEHLHHLKSFLSIDDKENISIIAPTAGTLRYVDDMMKNEGNLLFDVIPDNSMRLQVAAPIKNINNLTAVVVISDGCELSIASKEKVVKNFNITVWSTAIPSTCALTLGQNVVVSPIYQQPAFSVNKSAVFEFENNNYIAIKKQQQLALIAIEIISANNNQYIFTSTEALSGQQVLVSSVSALQGVLLKLGDE